MDVVNAEGAVSGPQYRVSGQLLNTADLPVSWISVVVTLYDAEARVVGYRQRTWGEEVTLAVGQTLDFQVLLTPQTLDAPSDFQVIAWAVLQG